MQKNPSIYPRLQPVRFKSGLLISSLKTLSTIPFVLISKSCHGIILKIYTKGGQIRLYSHFLKKMVNYYQANKVTFIYQGLGIWTLSCKQCFMNHLDMALSTELLLLVSCWHEKYRQRSLNYLGEAVPLCGHVH